jgi:hypothetical protein
MSHLNAASNKSAFLIEAYASVLFSGRISQLLTNTILSAIQDSLVTTHHLSQLLQPTDQSQPNPSASTLRSDNNILDMSRNTARMNMFAFHKQGSSSYKFV